MAGCLREDLPEDCLRLWASVVIAAIDDLSSQFEDTKRRTRAWFASTNAGIGSFLWCCDRLDLEPEAVRERVGLGLVTARPHVRARLAALGRGQ